MARAWDWTLGQNRVVPDVQADEGGAPPVKVNDQFWERLVKGVPVEAVGVYTAMVPFGQTAPAGAPQFVTLVILFILGLAATFLAMTVLRKVSWRDPDPAIRRVGTIQVVLALLAFAVWAYAQGGFFAKWQIASGTFAYQDFVAGILAVVMGFVLILSDQITGTKQPTA
jgi:hypothetical protein